MTVDHVDEVPEGSTVVFSAHGSPPDDFREGRRAGPQGHRCNVPAGNEGP